MKRPLFIILEALWIGQTIEMKNGWTYGMSENDEICIKMTSTKNGISEDMWLKQDVSIGQFDRLCDEFSFEELFMISSHTALTKITHESIEKRNRQSKI